MYRGNCKTPRPGKIDDFESVCQPLQRPSSIPKHILQASRAWGWGGKMAQKGDFAVAWSFAIASTTTCELMTRKRPKGGLLYRFVLFTTKCFFKILYRHKVYGKNHFCHQGAIVASNHTSYLDPPVLAISCPEELHFLAKEGLFKNKLFGAFIRALNSHPVKGGAGDIGVLKLTCHLLNEDKKVLMFPEGHRSHTDQLQPLKPGITLLIARSQAAVIPAYIHGTFAIWGARRRWPKLTGRTACVFGSPILWDEFSHLEKKAAQEAFNFRLTSAIEGLRSWYDRGAKGAPP